MLPLVAAGLTVKATVELGEGEEMEVNTRKPALLTRVLIVTKALFS